MVQVLFSILVVLTTVPMFLFNIQVVKFSETLKSLPITMVASTIEYEDINEIYYFNTDELEPLICEYFRENLSDIASDIYVGFSYYDEYHKKIYTNTPQEVQIQLNCVLQLNFSFRDSINFKVRDTYVYLWKS